MRTVSVAEPIVIVTEAAVVAMMPANEVTVTEGVPTNRPLS